MAALAVGLSIGSLVVDKVGPLVIQQIINLFQKAHPVPSDATPAVKADLNNLKSSGALQMLTVLANQLGTSGQLQGVTATDPAVQSELKGAIEVMYQVMKSTGVLAASTPDPLGALAPGSVAPPNASGSPIPASQGAPAAAPKPATLTGTLQSGSKVTVTVF